MIFSGHLRLLVSSQGTRINLRPGSVYIYCCERSIIIIESWLTHLHLTSFQLGVLFLPQTLESIPQFSCTEKSRSSLVIANRSLLLACDCYSANLFLSSHVFMCISRIASPLAGRSRPSWSRFAGKATKKRNHLRKLSDCLCHINSLHNLTAQKVSRLS
jgi:hypothetical protein